MQKIKASKIAKAQVTVDTSIDGNNFNAEETFVVEVFAPININRTLPQGQLFSTSEVEQVWEAPDATGATTQTTAIHSGVIISKEAVEAAFGADSHVKPGTKIVVRPFIQGADSKSTPGKGKGKARLQFVKFA